MSKEPILAKIARAVLDAPPELFENDKDYFEFLKSIAGRALTLEQVAAIDSIVVEESEAGLAELQRSADQRAAAKEILAELPETTTFAEACQIKAKQGNALAQRYADYFNSREYRVLQALGDAAADAHPGWKREEKGHYEKDGGAPEGNELIEWFQKTHSREARAIEDAIA